MKALSIVLICISLIISVHAELRIWTGLNGQTFEAEYVKDASGMDIRYKEYFIADMKIDTFTLKEKNDTYSFKGQDMYFEYDPDPAWGNRYEGYALCVRTTEGVVLVTKGPDKFTKHIETLKAGKVKRTRYKKDFTISTRGTRY